MSRYSSIKNLRVAVCIILGVSLLSACASSEKRNFESQLKQIESEAKDSPRFAFKGEDIVGTGPLDVIADRTQNRIIVKEPRFDVSLPYATDWVFTLTRYNVFQADSKQLNLVASVSVHPLQAKIYPSHYLFAHQVAQEKRMSISNARVESKVEPPYLIYQALGRTDIWWASQSERLQVFRLHVSTSELDDSKISKLLEQLQPMVKNGFKIKELRAIE